jgi:transposase
MRILKGPAELGFNRYDVHRLRKALKAVSDKRPFRRLQAVLRVAPGHLINEISQTIEVSVPMIYHWMGSYLQNHRVESFFDAPRSGRPPAAKSITAKRLQPELGRNPLRLGYRTTVWTVALLARQLNRRYDCSISPRTWYRGMRQMGLRSKRPRSVYSEKDPHRARKKGPSSGN